MTVSLHSLSSKKEIWTSNLMKKKYIYLLFFPFHLIVQIISYKLFHSSNFLYFFHFVTDLKVEQKTCIYLARLYKQDASDNLGRIMFGIFLYVFNMTGAFFFFFLLSHPILIYDWFHKAARTCRLRTTWQWLRDTLDYTG